MTTHTLLYLSLMPEKGDAPFTLTLKRSQAEGQPCFFGIELEMGSPQHQISEADFPALIRDMAAFEPNRWREEANLERIKPPLSDQLTVDQDLLLRAMALVMAASGVAPKGDADSPDAWLMTGLVDGLTIIGPARQHRTIHLIDPNAIQDQDLELLDNLWREGFLMELVINPRQDLGSGVLALYATPAWNKTLIPKVINLGEPENEFWKRRLNLMESGPQVQV